MAFCGKCGTQINDGVKFCPSCGAPIAAPAQPQPRPQQAQPQKQPQPQQVPNDYAAKLQNLNNTADTTASFAPNDIAQNKAMAILAYFGPLVFIPIFAAQNSRYARFHANQGLVLLLAAIGGSIAASIVSVILGFIKLGFIGSLLSTVISLACFVLFIIGLLNAINGRAKELPVIGKIKLLK